MTAKLRRVLAERLEENARMRAEITESGQILETVTDCTLTGWWDWPLDRPRAHLASGFWRLLGYPAPPSTPVGWLELLESDERTRVHGALSTWLSDGGEGQFSTTQQYRDQAGEQLWLHCSAIVFERDPDGRPTRLVGGHTDITSVMDVEGETLTQLHRQTEALRRLNRELEGRTAALQRANSALEDFAYAASHDLQAPLRAIAHFATWIDEDLPEEASDAVLMYVHRLKDRVERMTRLQENLLAYARITGQDSKIIQVDLPELARDVWLLVNPPESFTLALHGPSSLKVTVEEDGLRTVLRNLFSNAINHHDGTGGTVAVSYASGNRQVVIEVVDDGPGVPDNEAERIFRATHTGTSPRGGTGMGLAIARRHAEHANGEVVLIQTEGRGATFRVTWPVH